MRIEKGNAYNVWISEDIKDQVAISKQGSVIHIDYTGSKTYNRINVYDDVIITCPKLNSITTSNALIPLTSAKYNYVGYGGETNVSGFIQDSLQIKTGGFTKLRLENNVLQKIDAKVGTSGMSYSKLIIHESNKLASGTIDIPGKSELSIKPATAVNLKIISSHLSVVKDSIDNYF